MQGESALADIHADRHVEVRSARGVDFPVICALVNRYIEDTTFNFRTEPQTPGEWIEEWSATRASHPWLVAILDGVLAGVAYAGPWKGRRAYDWCAEVTVYVAQDARGTGVGRALYRRLLDLLDGQGYRTLIAAIALPNGPSVALHESCGFRHVGTLSGVGHKHGEWLDVGFWQRGEGRGEPPAPVLAVPRDEAPGADPHRPAE
jgi:phosphinothricin acetyltransferase